MKQMVERKNSIQFDPMIPAPILTQSFIIRNYWILCFKISKKL